jgi:hypothetical protein
MSRAHFLIEFFASTLSEITFDSIERELFQDVVFPFGRISVLVITR